MITFVSKSGKTITLRAPESGDIPALYEYAKAIEAEDTFITLNPDEPISYEEEEKYFAGVLKRIANKEHVSIFVFDGDKMIGSAGIDKGGKRKRHIGRLGIALKAEYRGDGIGRKLLEHTIAMGKETLGINLVFLEHFINNPVARSLYESVGFKEIGFFPQAVYYKGEYIDEAIMVKKLS